MNERKVHKMQPLFFYDNVSLRKGADNIIATYNSSPRVPLPPFSPLPPACAPTPLKSPTPACAPNPLSFDPNRLIEHFWNSSQHAHKHVIFPILFSDDNAHAYGPTGFVNH